MTTLFRLGQYVRINRNVWANQWGIEITDKHTIAQLEAEYKAHQRAASRGPVAPMAQLPTHTPTAQERKGLMTPRQKRGNGRQE